MTKTTTSERERQRLKQARTAAAERDVFVPAPADLGRRASLLADPFGFLRFYFKPIFWQPFTNDRREMVEAIIRAAQFAGDFALAGPRGEGKTKLALFTSLWLSLKGVVRLPLIIGRNQSAAENELDNLKRELAGNKLLAADFPEVCYPLIALDGWASRARKQTVNGHPTNIGWAKDCVFLPTIPVEALGPDWPAGVPSLAQGQGIATVGIDGRIRGFNRRNIRPDLAIIDDIDSRESARSAIQTDDFKQAIDQDIAGLGGSGQRTSRVMLCTIINRRSIAWHYTSLPGWQPKRFKSLVKLPDSEALWLEYVDKREHRPDTDPEGREAHRFYLANRAAMDAGAIVSNPYGFISKPGSDGAALEVSALQHCYNFIADNGWPAFKAEYQNEPDPEADEISKAGVTRQLVASRISGMTRGELPPQSEIAIGCDVGKQLCHWVAGAVRCEGGAAHVVNYGIIEVHGTEGAEQREIIERAILQALCGWKDDLQFRDGDGNPVPIVCTLIDSGYCPDAVFEFVRRYGEPFRASKGSANFYHGVQAQNRRVGNHWFATPQAAGVWLYTVDPTHWKRAVHDRFVTEPLDANNRPNPGSLSLFVPEGRRDHATYSAHILAEEFITEFIPGKGERSRWLCHSSNNHFLDATALMLAAAEMAGCGQGIRRQEQRNAVISAGFSRPDGRPWL